MTDTAQKNKTGGHDEDFKNDTIPKDAIFWKVNDRNETIWTWKRQNPSHGQAVSIQGTAGRRSTMFAYPSYFSDESQGTFNFSVCQPGEENPLDALEETKLDFFRNCSIGAEYAISFNHYSIGNASTGPSAELSMAFWRESLPEDWRGNATDCQINDYFLKSSYFMYGAPVGNYGSRLLHPLDKICFNHVCESMGFHGNPDIAGIGLIITYASSAFLTALYVLHYRKRLFKLQDAPAEPKEPLRQNSPWSKRHSKALDETARSFLGASLVLCYASWIAGFGYMLTGSPPLYECLMTITVGLFTTNPSICVFALLYDREGSQVKSLVAVLGQLYFAVTFGISSLWDYSHKKSMGYSDWFCFQGYAMGHYPNKIAALLLIGYVPPLLGLLAPFIPWIWGRGRVEGLGPSDLMSSRTRAIIRTWTACYALALTIIDLALIINMRRSAKRMDGATYDEDTWGFGQYFAVVGVVALFLQYAGLVFFPKSEEQKEIPLKDLTPTTTPTPALPDPPSPSPIQAASPPDPDDGGSGDIADAHPARTGAETTKDRTLRVRRVNTMG